MARDITREEIENRRAIKAATQTREEIEKRSRNWPKSSNWADLPRDWDDLPRAKISRAPIAADKADTTELDNIRAVMRQARDLKMIIADLETQLKSNADELATIERVKLPEMFAAAKIDTLGLSPEGNYRGYDAKLKPYYKAVIAAKWPADRREAAFNYLTELKADDLIKSIVTTHLPKNSTKVRKAVVAALEKLGVEFELSMDVPWGSLTAWLKERTEKEKKTTRLDLIGGEIGAIVSLDERKAEK